MRACGIYISQFHFVGYSYAEIPESFIGQPKIQSSCYNDHAFINCSLSLYVHPICIFHYNLSNCSYPKYSFSAVNIITVKSRENEIIFIKFLLFHLERKWESNKTDTTSNFKITKLELFYISHKGLKTPMTCTFVVKPHLKTS